jgi:hypothetical protein
LDDGEDFELVELENRRLFPKTGKRELDFEEWKRRGTAEQGSARASPTSEPCATGSASKTIPGESRATRSTRIERAALRRSERASSQTIPVQHRRGGANSIVQRSKEAAMKAAFANVGIFADYAGTPGAEFLEHSEPNLARVDTSAVQNIFDRLEIVPGGYFKTIPTVLLESSERIKLISELDGRCGSERDLKIPLSEEELGHLIGSKRVKHLANFLPRVDQIYLRRCAEYGKYIRFHIDEALWTMQMPLNDPQDYRGGRLVYVTENCHLECPHRAAGTATLHNGSVLHGVTKLESGVRYSLYFLQLKPEFQYSKM